MSVSDEVSISATSLSQSSKYSIDPGTLLAAANAPTKFGEFKYSLAYEKGLTKVNCGLCRMNFHKDSVFYKVANNRIISLQKTWNFTQIGRRYQTASYLYKSVTVCTFCSQFFYFSPEEVEAFKQNSEQDEKHSSTDIVEKQILNVSTIVQRSDVAAVAVGHKTFQSSEMDDKSAECAVTPPYVFPAKTRREVDPWWEIDFGRGYRIHSISFLIATGIKQDLGLHIILLQRPYGFDDPFLDSMVKKGLLYKEYKIPPQDSNRMEEVLWILPTDMQCTGVRIQLKGIHFLSVQKFQAFQGDNLVDLSSEENNGLQELRENSLISVGPRELRAYLADMVSPEKKKQMVEEKSWRPPKRTFDEKKVFALSETINANHDKFEAWRNRVLEHASIFTTTEIQDLYQVVFKYVADVDSRNKTHPGIVEAELLSVALTQHYPRCDLVEIHTRIRSIVRWYQTRTHLKLLGSLANCASFEPFAKDPTNYLYGLLSCFKRLDYYWNKKEELEKMSASQKKKVSNLVRTTVAESRGCSWPQFVIIMSLFCAGQPLKIPKLAFNIDEERVSNPNTAIVDVSTPSDDRSVSSHGNKSLEGKTVSTFSVGVAALPHLHNNKDSSGHSTREKSPSKWDALAATPMKPFEEFPAENRNKSILEAVRKESIVPPYNSSFAEYKFDKFKRRVILTEIPFPKTLSLEFAETLIPKRAATSSGRIRKDTPTSQSMENLTATSKSSPFLTDSNHGSPMGRMSFMKSPGMSMKSPAMFSDRGGAGDVDDNLSRMSEFSRSQPSFDPQKDPALIGGRRGGVQFDLDSMSIASNNADEFKKGVVDFFRICALCGVKFPRDCMQMQVMRKHIVKLRSAWNPDLISPEIRLLDNTLSMYSLVSVCVYCTQFFDPDYPEGIAYPLRDVVEDKKIRGNIGPIDSIKSHQTEAKMDTYYDSRYDNAGTGLSGILKNLEFNHSLKRDLETRERARKATEIAMLRRSASMPDKL